MGINFFKSRNLKDDFMKLAKKLSFTKSKIGVYSEDSNIPVIDIDWNYQPERQDYDEIGSVFGKDVSSDAQFPDLNGKDMMGLDPNYVGD